MTAKQIERQHDAAAHAARPNPKKRLSRGWRLPSGAALAEFALSSGFITLPFMTDSRDRGRVRKNHL